MRNEVLPKPGRIQTVQTVVKRINSVLDENAYIEQPLSLLEKKLLAFAISKYQQENMGDTVCVSFKEFWKACGITNLTSPRYKNMVCDAASKFASKLAQYRENNSKADQTAEYWQGIKSLYTFENGEIGFEFVDMRFLPDDKHKTNEVLEYKLESATQLQSKYGFSLFEALLCFENMGPTLEWSIESLAVLLGAEGYLKSPADFHKRVLKVAVDDINKNQNEIEVTFAMQKKGRAFSDIVFHIKRNKQEELSAEKEMPRLKENNDSPIPAQYIRPSTEAADKKKHLYIPPAAPPSSDLEHMSGPEFEEYCAFLLHGDGFKDIFLTSGSGDQGVDILAEKDGIKYAIQCKHFAAAVGNKAVQEVAAGKVFYSCHVGVVMTNTTFTKGAKDLAGITGTLLWGKRQLNSFAQLTAHT